MTSTTELLRFHKLTKLYRTAEVETVALDGLNMAVDGGEFVAVMGPSGCGKSTLLNIVGMLDNPSSGEYVFDGIDISRFSEQQLADLRKRNIGFIFQSFNLIDELTVFENVELALLYHGIPGAARRKRVGAVLERIGIQHRANHRPAQLSGGQQQRVAVARAVVAAPRLILADEPTGNLDTAHGAAVMNLLRDLNSDGTTVMMVTHSPTDAAFARRTINLLDGRIETNIARAA